jgi:hypothetical protein
MDRCGNNPGVRVGLCVLRCVLVFWFTLCAAGSSLIEVNSYRAQVGKCATSVIIACRVWCNCFGWGAPAAVLVA